MNRPHRRTTLVALALATLLVPAAIVAADDVQSLGFDPDQLHNALFGALRGYYGAPDVPAAVRALPADQKVAAVQVLGTFAKAWFGSVEFKKQYLDAYRQSKPRGFGLPSLDAKSLARAAIDKATKKPAAAQGLDKDPKKQLALRLRAFLDATADVDYAARTQGTGSSRTFESAELEAKPNEWKMCYRAGRETGEAVRAFAQGWLDELQPRESN